MLRRLFLLALAALLMLTGMPFVHAEEDFFEDDFLDDLIVENVPPSELVIVESESIRVTSDTELPPVVRLPNIFRTRTSRAIPPS